MSVSGLLSLSAAVIICASCTSNVKSSHVWLTSESGDKCSEVKPVVFRPGTADNAIVVDVNDHRQIIDGFAFDVEYIYIAKLNNLTMKEIGVIWSDDRTSTVSPFKSSMKFFGSVSPRVW